MTFVRLIIWSILKFQFYGNQTDFFQRKCLIDHQYFIFQSQCHIPHQLQICHLLVFHLSTCVTLIKHLLSYVSPGQYTFSFKGSKNVPIKGVDDKRQVTATFAVSSVGKFLAIQLIYTGKTARSLPKYEFPASFSVGFTKNHWSNTDKSIEFFDEIIFPYLQQVKEEKGLPQEHHSLVIMDTFKGQDNDILKEFCSKNRCEVVIVPHNLTNKFQPLDLTVNKATKAFIQNQYNDWFSDQVARQLKSGKDPTDIKVSSKLSDLKPLHASWIVDLYKHMQGDDELILKGFKEAGIYEAINDAQEVFERVENPFRA